MIADDGGRDGHGRHHAGRSRSCRTGRIGRGCGAGQPRGQPDDQPAWSRAEGAHDVDVVAAYADMLQTARRTIQSVPLLSAAGAAGTPVPIEHGARPGKTSAPPASAWLAERTHGRFGRQYPRGLMSFCPDPPSPRCRQWRDRNLRRARAAPNRRPRRTVRPTRRRGGYCHSAVVCRRRAARGPGSRDGPGVHRRCQRQGPHLRRRRARGVRSYDLCSGASDRRQ